MQVQMLAREGAFGGPSINPTTSTNAIPSSTRQLHTTTPRLNLSPIPPGLPPPQGPIQLILSTIRAHGLRGLWLGQTGTLFRETGGSSAWFTTYELTSRYLLSVNHSGSTSKSDLKAWELMLSGAMAGMSYNVILFPADSVKSAMQTWGELHPDQPRLGFGEMGKKIWKTRGFKGLYAGCGLTVMRSAPSSAMIFLIYETLMTRFGGILG
jgi:ornithine carrier protein